MNYREMKPRFSLDTITEFSDDDLYQTFQKIKGELEACRLHSQMQAELQIETCYLQREIQLREARKTRHAVYVNNRHGGRYQSRHSGYSKPHHKKYNV